MRELANYTKEKHL